MVPFHLLLVVEVLDKVIPSHGLILRGNRMQSGYIVLGGIGLVVTSFNQKNLVAGDGEPGGEGCTTRTRADNDILVILESSVGGRVVKCTLNICAAEGRVLSAVTVLNVSNQTFDEAYVEP